MLAMHSQTNPNHLHLKLESTLQELPLWKIYVEVDRPANDLAILFQQEPLLPGIILTKNQEYLGMISRQRFFEHMSRPYSLSLFSGRPTENLYNFLQPQVFLLSGDTPIVEATQVALQRVTQLVYEPIVVKIASGEYELMDFHQLLLAYSQIHVLTVTQLQRVEEQSRIAKAGFHDLQQNYIRLLQHDKMAALGQLVAGIAHEINNPVNFIAGNLIHAINYSQDLLQLISLYQQKYPDSLDEIENFSNEIDLDFIKTDLPDLLTSMKVGTKRIQQIVCSLRHFSRLDEAEQKTVDIHQGIDSTLLILQSRLANITLVKEYANLPLVECYAGLLNQVFLNILANAIDALVDHQELACKTVNCPTIHISTEITDDQHIVISISDNGTGIPESLQKRLFEPFFTTKPIGKGTGLGLSISYQIVVEKHGGQLEFKSELGAGTEFIIKIPVKLNSCRI